MNVPDVLRPAQRILVTTAVAAVAVSGVAVGCRAPLGEPPARRSVRRRRSTSTSPAKKDVPRGLRRRRSTSPRPPRRNTSPAPGEEGVRRLAGQEGVRRRRCEEGVRARLRADGGDQPLSRPVSHPVSRPVSRLAGGSRSWLEGPHGAEGGRAAARSPSSVSRGSQPVWKKLLRRYSLTVVLGDPERPTHADGRQLAGVHQTVDGHLRHAHDRGDLGDGQELHLRDVPACPWTVFEAMLHRTFAHIRPPASPPETLRCAVVRVEPSVTDGEAGGLLPDILPLARRVDWTANRRFGSRQGRWSSPCRGKTASRVRRDRAVQPGVRVVAGAPVAVRRGAAVGHPVRARPAQQLLRRRPARPPGVGVAGSSGRTADDRRAGASRPAGRRRRPRSRRRRWRPSGRRTPRGPGRAAPGRPRAGRRR